MSKAGVDCLLICHPLYSYTKEMTQNFEHYQAWHFDSQDRVGEETASTDTLQAPCIIEK
jgi:hypothetical protein